MMPTLKKILSVLSHVEAGEKIVKRMCKNLWGGGRGYSHSMQVAGLCCSDFNKLPCSLRLQGDSILKTFK